MSAGESAVDALKAEIERKYQEALKALEVLRGYLADTPQNGYERAASAGRLAIAPKPDSDKSNVDIVMDALTLGGSYKTVEQLHDELGLPEATIRHVLYSKFVASRLSRAKVGKKTAFRRRYPIAAKASAGADGGPTITGLIRGALTKHPAGLTVSQIADSISDGLSELGSDKKAVAASLGTLKQRGKVAHDAETGIYRLNA